MSPDNHNEDTERRSGIDRRQFSYALHIPERRTRKERRRDWSKRPRHLRDAIAKETAGFSPVTPI